MISPPQLSNSYLYLLSILFTLNKWHNIIFDYLLFGLFELIFLGILKILTILIGLIFLAFVLFLKGNLALLLITIAWLLVYSSQAFTFWLGVIQIHLISSIFLSSGENHTIFFHSSALYFLSFFTFAHYFAFLAFKFVKNHCYIFQIFFKIVFKIEDPIYFFSSYFLEDICLHCFFSYAIENIDH